MQMQLELPAQITEDEARLFLAMALLQNGRLSLGQAAELAGYSRGSFMEILGHHGVPVFDYEEGDLERESAL